MRRHAALFLAIALLGGALDLWTKHLAFAHVPDYGEERIIDGFYTIGRTINKGVIFGKFQGAEKLWLVVSIAAVPAILAIFFTIRKHKWILTICLGMILAGTIGNMYDRVTIGGVRDFIKFYDVPLLKELVNPWPLFNLADSYICVGVFLLSIEMLFFDEKKKKKDDVAQTESAAPPAAIPGPGPVGQG